MEADSTKASNLTSKIIDSYDETMTGKKIRSAFLKAGFVLETNENPIKVKFDEEIVKNNPGYKELEEANIKLSEISERRRNNTYGWINKQEYKQSKK